MNKHKDECDLVFGIHAIDIALEMLAGCACHAKDKENEIPISFCVREKLERLLTELQAKAFE